MGPIQCIDRAELVDLLRTLCVAIPPVTVHTDSDFVFQGVMVRGQISCCMQSQAHADVWELVWERTRDFGGAGPDSVTLVKVKAHPTPVQRRMMNPVTLLETNSRMPGRRRLRRAGV